MNEFYTLHINLSLSAEKIFSNFKKDTRNEIRRAEKDGLLHRNWSLQTDSSDFYSALEGFTTFYTIFAQQKGLSSLDRPLLEAYADSGCINISQTSTADGTVLTWHVYIREKQITRLLYSASHFRDQSSSTFRSLIGRANRFHHWQDILWLKASSTLVYDFGGYYEGTEDKEKLRINRFKEEFGGVRVACFNGFQPLTFLGRIYNLLQRFRHQQ
ncbi:MAG: hypothetical protein V4496_01650 [Pseudomonadota bacterium]